MNKEVFPITQNKFFSPILRYLIDGKIHSVEEIRQKLINNFRLTKEQLEIPLPSGRETVFSNRLRWAKYSLVQYGYIDSPEIGKVRITEGGLKLFRRKEKITKNRIARISEIQKINKTDDEASKGKSRIIDEQVENTIEKKQGKLPETSPDDEVQAIVSQTEKDLPTQLLSLLRTIAPKLFEQIANQVIEKMYNQPIKQLHGGSDDKGIDGVIGEGFEQIAIQSKRYQEHRFVGENDLKLFDSNLSLHGAPRGIFVTASKFHHNAIKLVKENFPNIRLVDGEELVRLMISHEVGVEVTEYKLKIVKEEYFKIHS